MSAFPNWEQYAMPQKRPESGCIPTGYEMLLRAAKVPGINFATFQDEFDLDKNRQPHEQPRNNFDTVANAINAKYNNIKFVRTAFPKGEGARKLTFVEEQISKGRFVLISLSMERFHQPGWHIMPVIDMNDNDLFLLHHTEANGKKFILTLKKSEFIDIHNNCAGGDDIAYLKDL
jgi:hypothetical protein